MAPNSVIEVPVKVNIADIEQFQTFAKEFKTFMAILDEELAEPFTMTLLTQGRLQEARNKITEALDELF